MEISSQPDEEGAPLCTAARTALLLDVDKGLRPCSAYQGKHLPGSPSVATTSDATFREILTGPVWTEVRDQLDRREVPPGCRQCLEREVRVGTSQRMTMRRRQSPNWHKGITYLELNSTNLCNLLCRHCNASYSSRWAKHDQRHGDKHAKIILPNGEMLRRNLQSVDLHHLNHVVIKGGEPMMNSDVLVLLEHLEAIGVVEDVTLHMVTNGTVVDPGIVALMRRVRSCQITVSIDGVGDVQDYVRHGGGGITRIEQAIAAYAAMPNVTLSRNTAVMAYNVFRLDEIDAWWNGLATRFPGNYNSGKYDLFVLFPQSLAVHCLQDHTRAALVARYRAKDPELYAPVMRVLEQPFAGQELHDEFVRRTQQTDLELGCSVAAAIPELAVEMKMLVTDPSAGATPLPANREWRQHLIEAQLEDAWKAVDRQDWQVAEEIAAAILDPLAEEPPRLRVAAMHVQAIAASLCGDVERGLGILNRAISMAPNSLVLRLHRGRIFEQLGDFKAASADARAAMSEASLLSDARQILQRCGGGD